MNLANIQKSLQGKKTYLATGFGLIYLAGVFLGLWEWNETVLAVFGLSGLAFLRAAVPQAAVPTPSITTNNHSKVSLNAPLILALVGAGLLMIGTGCARFSTVQTDIRYDDQGKKTTQITTRAKASTLFSARSDLANWQARQSEGEQGAEVGSLSQESSSTNAVAILQALSAIVQALPK